MSHLREIGNTVPADEHLEISEDLVVVPLVVEATMEPAAIHFSKVPGQWCLLQPA